MYFEKVKPSPPLEKYIACYWIAKVDGCKTIREINPNSNICVCFHLGHMPKYKMVPRRYWCGKDSSVEAVLEWVEVDSVEAQNVIIGPHRSLILETSENYYCAVGIEFKTGIRKTFFGVDNASLSGKVMPLGVDNSVLSDIPAIISRCDVDKIFRMIDNCLMDNFLPCVVGMSSDNILQSIIDEIIENPFDANVAVMADKLNICVRTFERQFKQYTGLSPKQFICVKKIGKVIDCMKKHPDYDLVQVVWACGYYDQAHINRDFQIIGGLPATLVFQNVRRYMDFTSEPFCLNYDVDGVCGFNLLI